MSESERLARAIGRQFARPGLLEQALTHRSADATHNERLEFLGDSVLELVISEVLYERFPAAREGQLTRTRAGIVKGSTLARVARRLDLGAYIRLGGGELKSGGFDRDSILADALEAVIGAIYLDGGLEAARAFIHRLFARELESANPARVVKDPKTMLQEWLQGRGLDLPEYRVESVTGASHDQRFVVQCRVSGDAREFTGAGTSRRNAEQAAAAEAFEALSATEGDGDGR